MVLTQMSKLCSACGKPVDHSSRSHQSACRACLTRGTRESRALRPDYYIAYDRMRNSRPARKKAAAEARERRRKEDPDIYAQRSREWRERNREKYKATYTLRDSVTRGKIIKPSSCSRCDAPAAVVPYHRDYSRPFDVMWLCKACIRDQRAIARSVERGEASWLPVS